MKEPRPPFPGFFTRMWRAATMTTMRRAVFGGVVLAVALVAGCLAGPRHVARRSTVAVAAVLSSSIDARIGGPVPEPPSAFPSSIDVASAEPSTSDDPIPGTGAG